MIGLTRLEITVTCQGPLRIDGEGIDVYRDWAGRVCIPATLLKGHTRDHVRRLASALGESICDPGAPCDAEPCAVCRLFGSRRHEGAVAFADLFTDTVPIMINRPRIARSRTRGVSLPAETQPILVVPAGAEFSGVVRHHLSSIETQPLALLVAALRGIKQIGTGGAIGWGQCMIGVRGVLFEAAVLAAAFRLDN
jgi:CRISPR/Cas system CSM-associated protein Csm3 (group 7 of RAMP superfamily)